MHIDLSVACVGDDRNP